MPRITFHGAVETVTGSKYLVEAGGAKILVDCGLFQGSRRFRDLNWAKPTYDPKSVDAVVLTHAHLDHTGWLPRLWKEGFRGPIHQTQATRELTELILYDAANIQESDADYANRKGFSKHAPALPLFDGRDVDGVKKLFRTMPREEWRQVKGPIWVRLHDAGHLLGSNMIEMEIREAGPPLRILFSGDVGRYKAPIYHDPHPPTPCDYLICETTYGNREHGDADMLTELAEVVHRSIRRGGVMLVAAFAVGRTQQIVYLLQLLMYDGRIPRIPVYVDSPMAVDTTNIYREHREDHDLEEGQLQGRDSVLAGRDVHMSRSVNESKAINALRGPGIIISSSGMMTGGRILHHLRQRLPSEHNTILIGGFQAEGTRGRSLEEGAPTLRIHGRDIPVRAAIEKVSGLSGHAGRSELLRWLEPLEAPRLTFLTHGEPESAKSFAQDLLNLRSWKVAVPKLGESFELT